MPDAASRAASDAMPRCAPMRISLPPESDQQPGSRMAFVKRGSRRSLSPAQAMVIRRRTRRSRRRCRRRAGCARAGSLSGSLRRQSGDPVMLRSAGCVSVSSRTVRRRSALAGIVALSSREQSAGKAVAGEFDRRSRKFDRVPCPVLSPVVERRVRSRSRTQLSPVTGAKCQRLAKRARRSAFRPGERCHADLAAFRIGRSLSAPKAASTQSP